MEADEETRNPRPDEIPGLIHTDGKPIVELLDEAFAPVPEGAQARRQTIGEIYTHKKVADEAGHLRTLSLQFGVPLMPELPTDHMSVEFTRKVPIQYLKRQKLVPVETPDAFLIAVNDPANFQAVDDLMRLLGRTDAEVVLSPEGAILAAISTAYDLGRDSAQEFIQIMNGDSADSIISEIEETADLLDDTSDAPIIKLVNLVLAQASRTARATSTSSPTPAR
jgi:general secretion pathway protein E